MRAGEPDTMEGWMRSVNRRLTRLEQEARAPRPPAVVVRAAGSEEEPQDEPPDRPVP